MSSSTLTSKSSIILNSSSDWNTWIGLIKGKAEASKVWKYVNPDIAEPPEIDQPGELADNATNAQLEKYRRQCKIYDKAEEAIVDLQNAIYDSISSSTLQHIINLKSVHEKLVELRSRFRPANHSSIFEISGRLNALRASIKKRNIYDWLNDYETIYSESKQIQHTFIGIFMFEVELLEAIKQVDEHWAVANQVKLMDQLDNRPPLVPVSDNAATVSVHNHVDDVHKIVKQYAAYKRATGAVSTSKGTALATFQGESNTTKNDKSTQQHGKKPLCLCGQNHFFRSCCYINPAATKPANYSEKVQREVNERYKSSSERIRSAIDKIRAEFKNSQESSQGQDSKPSKSNKPVSPGATLRATTFHEDVPFKFSASYVLDGGSDVHVCNNPAIFNIETVHPGLTLGMGYRSVPVDAVGSFKRPRGYTLWTELHHPEWCLFVPSVPNFTNLSVKS
ncbi:hypothetical protein M501DRAFT_999363 [Patellaria atrata CBS 101060]|uniref:Uncharacterized protein n=1 Tax=Patellaria atrata CBS 101060 TaxID=1346257 RepID=A0A9P4S5B8_9PEZI|nr:hypothetical protein M501DRAFT_999363 [Patellaria atrata CBS 101060]